MYKKLSSKTIISSLICTIPILLGVIFWSSLPSEVAIHIGLRGISKGSKLIGLVIIPVVFLAFNFMYCIKPDWFNAHFTKHRFWLFPFMSNAFYIFIISFS